LGKGGKKRRKGGEQNGGDEGTVDRGQRRGRGGVTMNHVFLTQL